MIDLYLAVAGELFYHFGCFFLKRWRDPSTPYEWDYTIIMLIAICITYAAYFQGYLCNAFTDIAAVFFSNKAGRVILRALRIIL